jgi:LPXTG-site transpeptidase (sortase) family protein
VINGFPNRLQFAVGLIGLGILLGVAAIGIAVYDHRTVSVPPAAAVMSGEAPSSAKPSVKAVDTYSVPLTDPKYITIPVIKVAKTRVIQLGVTKDNHIAVPDNIYDTGWYKASARPGESGAMFIYGHVSSWESNGAFYDLKKLKPGDMVTVTRGDNHEFTYKVITSETYPVSSVPMDKILAPITPGQQGLNLMTCSGKVIKGTSEFTDRLVVYASLVKG